MDGEALAGYSSWDHKSQTQLIAVFFFLMLSLYQHSQKHILKYFFNRERGPEVSRLGPYEADYFLPPTHPRFSLRTKQCARQQFIATWPFNCKT